MTVNNNNILAIQRTKLANQRTYLAYMRTGFVIASVAGTFKKIWIAAFGVTMIMGSLIQYAIINYRLTNDKDLNNTALDYIPMIYVFLSLGALYLQMYK